jgi:hypothetical protein
MKKNYFIILILTLFFAFSAQAQEVKNNSKVTDPSELGIYPNPVTQGKIYIISKNSLTKEIKIFDVVGKVVLNTSITNKELNVSNIQPGMYLIQIKEADLVITKKLIIK